MKAFSRITFVAVLTLAVMQAGVASAQEETKSEAAAPAKPTRAELRDKQLDVSLEARDIERVLSKLKRASDLAKERITEAAKTAESASTSLEKGDSKAAREEAQLTNVKLREIIQQLEALLKEETPQRIAEARQLAQKLAKAERDFAQQFPGMLNPVQAAGKGKVDPRSQIKPMPNPEAKGQAGAQGKNGGGKNGDKKDAEDKKDSDGKTGEKKDPKGNDPDQPGNKGSEPRKDGMNGDGKEKPMPNGAGSSKEQDKKNGNEPKSEGDGGGTKKKDEKKPGDSGEGANGDDPMKKDGGSGGDRKDMPDDKRDGTGDGGSAELTAEQRRELVAGRAEQLAESGKTLQDVLNEIVKSTEPGDKDAVAKIQEVMKEIDINKIVAEMGQIADMIRETKDADARLSSTDIAERLEIMAQRLDGAYRTIVAPQAEELRKVEAALAELRDQLEKLETPSQVAAWHREVRDLLDKLDKLGVSPKDREFLEKEITKAGFGLDVDRTNRAVNWGLVNGYYVYPAGYNFALLHLQEDIQERIQTLILGDLGNASDEATPPKYQELVNRYYEVLSRTAAGKSEARKPKSEAGAMKKAK